VPDKLTVCGLLTALSPRLSVPLALPLTVGANVTPIVHRALAAMPLPQVLVAIANGPLALTPVKLSALPR